MSPFLGWPTEIPAEYTLPIMFYGAVLSPFSVGDEATVLVRVPKTNHTMNGKSTVNELYVSVLQY